MDAIITLIIWALVAVTAVMVLGAQIWEWIFPPKPSPESGKDMVTVFWDEVVKAFGKKP